MRCSTNTFVPGGRHWQIIITASLVLAWLLAINTWAEDARPPSESADPGKKVQNLVEKGEFEQALEIVEGLAQKYSTRQLAGKLLIWTRDKQGQGKRAEDDLKRWQQTYPKDNGIAILLARYYRKNDQPKRAREILTKVVLKNEGIVSAYRSLASLEAEEGQRVQAIKWLAKMVQAKKSAVDDARWRVIDIAGSKTEAAELLNKLRKEKGLDREFSLAWAVATVAEAAQMTDEATVYYRGAIKRQPRFGQLYVYLAKLQLRQGRADEAMKTISQAQKVRAEGVRSFYQLEGLAYLLKDDMKAAIVSFEAAVGVEPSDTGAREILASVLLAVGRPDEAAQHLETLTAEDSAKQSVYRQLMEAYLADGRNQRAAELAAKVIAKDQLDPMTALTVARVFIEAKQAKLAIKILKSFSAPPAYKAMWKVLLVKALLSEKNQGKARKELAAWLDEIPTVDKRSELAASIVTVLAQAGEKAMASKLASKELKRNPDHPLLREALIRILLEKEDYKQAKKLIADWSAKQEQGKVGRLRAMVLLEEKNYVQAEQELRAMIKANPEDLESLRLLGTLYELTGKTEESNAQYEAILKIEPNDIWANNNLGYSLAEANERLDEAQEMIFLALRGGPSEATIADSMGWVLYKQGRFAQAVAYLARALRLTDEPQGELLEHLGDAYYRLKEQSRAVDAWNAGLQAELSEKQGDAKMVKRLQNKLKMVESEQIPPVAWSVVDRAG